MLTRRCLLSWTYYFFYATSFFGPAFLSYNLGAFSLYPARLFLVILWGWLIFALIKGEARIPEHQMTRPALLFFAAWLAYAGLSLTWAASPSTGIRDMLNLFMGLSIVGLVVVAGRPRPMAKIWLGVFFVLLALGLIEHLTSLHLPISRYFVQRDIQHLLYRPTGFFTNENNYASFIALSLPLLLGLWNRFKTKWQTFFWWTNMITALYLLFVTYSRINYIVVLLIVIIYSFLIVTPGRRLRVASLLLTLLICVGLAANYLQPAVRGNVDYWVNSLTDFISDNLNHLKSGPGVEPISDKPLMNDGSILVRINMMRNGFRYLVKTGGRGVGVGNFEIWIHQFSYFDTRGYVNPHNWWLELAAEFGVAIALAYGLFYLGLLAGVYRKWQKQQPSRCWLGEWLLIALVVFPLVAVSPSSFMTFYPQWLLLAVAFSYVIHDEPEVK